MTTQLTARTITEARFEAAEVAELSARPQGAGPKVVLQAEGLGSPTQWTSQFRTAAERIVVEYGPAARRFERAWTLSAQTGTTRYYTLDRNTDGGYISR